MSLGRVRISNFLATLKDELRNISYLQDWDVEVHALSIDLALKTTDLVKLECAFTAIDSEEEFSGEDASPHDTETGLH
jgi:hypothetical protein